MNAAKYILVSLSLVLLAGCIVPDGGGSPEFAAGQDRYYDQGRGPDGGGEQDRGDREDRGDHSGPR